MFKKQKKVENNEEAEEETTKETLEEPVEKEANVEGEVQLITNEQLVNLKLDRISETLAILNKKIDDCLEK